MYCVLDIESTGGAYGKESIMEIALFRYDGDEIVDQLISLVHPHKEIQKYVSKITGITSKMLLRAPRFEEIAKRILELTEGAILVGHNVEFDYRMLRQEYRRLGYSFEMKTMDTIPLAEKLIPGLPSYGLDKICDALGFYRVNKHRAESDARATLELFQLLQEKDKQKEISIMGQSVRVNDVIKDKIDDLRRSVKQNKGLYYLHNAQGDLLYMGASQNIKKSLNQIFMADNTLASKLKVESHSIRVEATGNNLVSRIKQVEESERSKPKYNKGFSLVFNYAIIDKGVDSKMRLFVKPIHEINSIDDVLLKAETKKEALKAIRYFKRTYPLDQREAVLEGLKNMPEEALFIGAGRKKEEHCVAIVENHQLLGYYFYNLHQQIVERARLKKNFTPVLYREEFTQMLKLYILSGGFKEGV